MTARAASGPPAGGPTLPGPDHRSPREPRRPPYKLPAPQPYARANRLDRIVFDSPRPRLGIVTAGKAYLDVRQALEEPADADLSWLLQLSDSIITYRARYTAPPQWLPVLDLLVRDEANPRSIAFQVRGLRDYARRLTELFGEIGDEIHLAGGGVPGRSAAAPGGRGTPPRGAVP